jgi:hypothetical protein
MSKSIRIAVRRQTTKGRQRTPGQIAELRAVRERFQREKPTIDSLLAATGATETMPLGDYLRAQELLGALRKERERQRLTLEQLSTRTGYDPAALSRLFTGRQANTTLATVGRIANALGKEVVHALRDLPATRRTSAKKARVNGR